MKDTNIAAIGIDSGMTGGISLLINGYPVAYEVTPRIGNEIDFVAFREILKTMKESAESEGYKVHGFIEKVQSFSKDTPLTAWKLSGAYHTAVMGLMCLGIPCVEFPPKTWQSKLFVGITPQYKKVKGVVTKKRDTKAMAALAARKLFPEEKFTDPNKPRAYVPHDGIVDATLVAYYGINFYYGKA